MKSGLGTVIIDEQDGEQLKKTLIMFRFGVWI